MHAGSEVTEITVSVFHPTQEEPIEKTWSWTKKVGDAAAEAAEAFGVTDAESATFADEDGDILQREKTLRAAGVEDGDELELTDTTGGVV